MRATAATTLLAQICSTWHSEAGGSPGWLGLRAVHSSIDNKMLYLYTSNNKLKHQLMDGNVNQASSEADAAGSTEKEECHANQ